MTFGYDAFGNMRVQTATAIGAPGNMPTAYVYNGNNQKRNGYFNLC